MLPYWVFIYFYIREYFIFYCVKGGLENMNNAGGKYKSKPSCTNCFYTTSYLGSVEFHLNVL